MELLILGGLLLLFMFAAVANRGEPEVETFVITRPARRENPLVPLLMAIVILLLLTALIDRAVGWLGA
jgi:hypothetical protein